MTGAKQLDSYTDDELWDLVEYPVEDSVRTRYQELFRLDALDSLTPAKQEELDMLSDEVDYCMGLRAVALDVLAARGYDVSAFRGD